MLKLLASNLINRAYCLALILVGADSAESIVTAAIEAVPLNELSEAALLTEVASAAWDIPEIATLAPDALNDNHVAIIPCSLRNLCVLPRTLRYCFSLRFLVGMTPYACGRIVGLRADQVDYLVMRSMLMLARVTEREEQQMLTAAH